MSVLLAEYANDPLEQQTGSADDNIVMSLADVALGDLDDFLDEPSEVNALEGLEGEAKRGGEEVEHDEADRDVRLGYIEYLRDFGTPSYSADVFSVEDFDFSTHVFHPIRVNRLIDIDRLRRDPEVRHRHLVQRYEEEYLQLRQGYAAVSNKSEYRDEWERWVTSRGGDTRLGFYEAWDLAEGQGFHLDAIGMWPPVHGRV